MGNPQHLEWLHEGVEAWNARREVDNFIPDFEGADLRDADLREARLWRANLSRADLREANLIGAHLAGAQLTGANLGGAGLMGAKLTGAELGRAKLWRADLREVDLRKANLTGANLREVNFTGADLGEAKLWRADLREADLREANLIAAHLTGADLMGVNLTGADLRRARLWQADLRRAKLWRADFREADVRSLKLAAGGKANAKATDANFTNLSQTTYLTQEQVNSMTGDTGTVLPDGLHHPPQWPEWDENDRVHEEPPEEAMEPVEPEIAETGGKGAGPFVFISYSATDRGRIAGLKVFLERENIPCWWNQDIPSGGKRRQAIAEHLDKSVTILTLWTEGSVNSDAVNEEAIKAQSQNKLVQARLGDAALPDGFSQTHYASLQDWDGVAPHHPGMRRLLQALRDKLTPPVVAELKKRLIEASPLTFQAWNGKLAAVDTPENLGPPILQTEDLKGRITAQTHYISKFLQDLKTQKSTVLFDLSGHLSSYLDSLRLEQPTWYLLEVRVEGIVESIDRHGAERWPDRLRLRCETLIKRHREMEPLIRPVQIPLDQPNAPRPAPQPDLVRLEQDQLGLDQLAGITREATKILASREAKAIFDEAALLVLETAIANISDGLEHPGYSERERQQRHRLLRRGLVETTGFVGGLVTVLSTGVVINLRTSSGAAATLLARLEQILAVLLKFF